MVDWATQDRLYPTGYLLVDIRYRRVSIDSSLPYSIALNKRHNCRARVKQSKRSQNANLFSEHRDRGLTEAIDFYKNTAMNTSNQKSSALLAKYSSNISWPRSVCCFFENDGSVVMCEQDRCRLLLLTSHLILRSTCGGKRGNSSYEFDSPWGVAALLDKSSSNVLVADTNNRRIQCFTIGYNDRFVHKYTVTTKEKPYFIATSKQHFAVSCENGLICTYLIKDQSSIASFNLNRISSRQKFYCLCLDPEESFLFVSSPTGSSNAIFQLTITGEYLRSIKFAHQPFLHVSSLTFDCENDRLVIADSINAIIYSVQYRSDKDNVQVLLKRSDGVNYPQSLCLGQQGHLIIVECSVLTEHALKIFRYDPSRATTTNLKTSVQSTIF